jgi:extracellular factor (EF) 3-hydroxypalmitic acid methyl ester biosynthesis protein
MLQAIETPARRLESSVSQPLLDETYRRLLADDIQPALDALKCGLNQIRDGMFIEAWNDFIREHCLDHPLRRLLHQDPFTLHAFSRPRGYCGDAVLLDFLFGYARPPSTTSLLGQAIFQYEFETSSAKSLRARREYFARQIDQVAERMTNPSVLCIGCGHLREAHSSQAIQEGRIGRLVALDSDPVSLELVRREHWDRSFLVPLNESIKIVLSRKLHLGLFDLIYAAGLYDYLPASLARRLTTEACALLKPAGRLVIANFLPTQPGRGYMEAFMDLWLVHRDEQAMLELAADVAESAVPERSLSYDPFRNLTYLELARH